jgi:N-acetylmuramoyl-L-alanine amidase
MKLMTSEHYGLLILSLALAVTSASAADVAVSVSVDVGPESTRLVLNHERHVSHLIRSSRKKITILYSEPVRLVSPTARIDGPLFDRLRQRGPRELVIETGKRFESFESFELRNPYRLILDLKPRPETLGRNSRRKPRERLPSTIIVIDPGHGGAEYGAIGPTGLKEKDVTLALARRLRLALTNARSSISVVLTRDEDRAVALDERTAIANHNRADLFLSIHLNSASRPEAWGAETYYLSTDSTDREARAVASQENREAMGDVKEDGALDLVLWDLAQNRHLAESSALADSIQRNLNELTGTRNRGVRQAPFRILMGATMPAILVEVGFVSNPEEEARFRTSEYMNQVVDAVVVAVQEFLRNLEQFKGSAPAGNEGPRSP